MTYQHNRREFLQAAGAIIAFALPLPFAALAQSSAKMKIGTLGSGRVGSAIGRAWVRAGHEVMFSSLDLEADKKLAASLGPKAHAGTPQGQRAKHRGRARLRRMQKVTEKNQLRGLVVHQQAAQTLQIFKRGARRHRLAERAVGCGFSEVQVSNEQHAPRWPPQGVLGQQPENFTGVPNCQRLADRRV